jgi:hypothetical protein
MKLKGPLFADVSDIQKTVTDELKKLQKDEFSAVLQKLYYRTKSCIYVNVAYFELKNGMCLPHKSLIFKQN